MAAKKQCFTLKLTELQFNTIQVLFGHNDWDFEDCIVGDNKTFVTEPDESHLQVQAPTSDIPENSMSDGDGDGDNRDNDDNNDPNGNSDFEQDNENMCQWVSCRIIQVEFSIHCPCQIRGITSNTVRSFCRSFNGFGGFHFPNEKHEKDVRDKWRVAVNKGVFGQKGKLWNPSKYDVVCHKHFRPEDFTKTEKSKRMRLKKGVVPSVFLERMSVSSLEKTELKEKRKERLANRRLKQLVESSPANPDSVSVPGVQMEIEVKSETTTDDCLMPGPVNVALQCDLPIHPKTLFSVERFKNNPKAMRYYTGFDNYEHFMMFYTCLGPAVDHLSKKYKQKPCEQLFITLMKLQQNKDDYEISLLFNVSETRVASLVNTWINFMYFQLSELDWWPSRSLTSTYMPEDFKRKYPSTRVILDATENPIQKPSEVDAQTASFSTYKNKNTLKTMVGVAPRGNITFVSDSYGGCASDRQIIERSDLCKKKLFDSKDSIMADRGIMVQDLFATKDVKVIIPTMLSGKSQLEPEIVVKDRRIASKRIHVERIIGLAKHFKMLKSDLPPGKVRLGSRIMYVCFMILNFRRCIVSKLA